MIAKELLSSDAEPSYLPVIHVFEGHLTKEKIKAIKKNAVLVFKDEENGDEYNTIYTFCDDSAILIMKDTTHMLYENKAVGCE